MAYLRTSDLARSAGVHPNTVRRYEERGWLPPAQRGANGYRRFTQRHLDCLRLARMIASTPFPVRAIRLSKIEIVERAAADDWSGALERGEANLALVRSERAQAEAAATLLERWATGTAAHATQPAVRIGQAAHALGVSIDVLRNWERNGLIGVPRTASNRYRAYGPAEISRLRVIRMLTRAGYSQMAILRMLLQLDRGETHNLRRVLDTPGPDEDARIAADRWLSTLIDQEEVALRLIAFIQEVIEARTGRQPLRPG